MLNKMWYSITEETHHYSKRAARVLAHAAENNGVAILVSYNEKHCYWALRGKNEIFGPFGSVELALKNAQWVLFHSGRDTPDRWAAIEHTKRKHFKR